MIGFKKRATVGKSKTKYITYDKFSTFAEDDGAGTLGACESLNCSSVDGNLTAGVGVKIYHTINGDILPIVSSEPKQYFIYNEPDSGYVLMAYLTYDGYAYYINEEDMVVKIFNRCYDNTKAYNCYNQNYEDILLLIGEWGLYAYNLDGLCDSLKNERARASCLCGNRLYWMSTEDTLVYSYPYDYFNFYETIDDAGSLNFYVANGYICGLVAYNDSVYMMREYEVIEVKTAGSARDFKVQRLPYEGGMILRESFFVFDDKLCFLATDGFYICDGKKIQKAYEKLNILPNKDENYIGYAICDRKLLMRYKRRDGSDDCVALCPGGEYGYHTTCFFGLGNYRGVAYCVYDGYLYTINDGVTMPDGEYRYFRSVAQDFGIKGRKTLKTLCFEGAGTFAIDVYVDGVKRMDRKFLKYENGEVSLPLDFRGEKFEFVFWVNTDSCMRRLIGAVEYV